MHHDDSPIKLEQFALHHLRAHVVGCKDGVLVSVAESYKGGRWNENGGHGNTRTNSLTLSVRRAGVCLRLSFVGATKSGASGTEQQAKASEKREREEF